MFLSIQEIIDIVIMSLFVGFIFKDIFKKDVWPLMRSRIYSSSPGDKTKDPGFRDTTTRGISTALDATEAAVDTIIRKPIISGTKGTIKVGSTAVFGTQKIIAQGSSQLWTASKFVASQSGKGFCYAGSKTWALSTAATGKIKRLFTSKKPKD